MRLKRGTAAALLLAAALLMTSGCQQAEVGLLPAEDFMAFADELTYRNTIASPLNASFTYGDLEAEGLEHLLFELDDASAEGLEEEIAELKADYEQLKRYDYDSMDPESKMIYDMLEFQLLSVEAYGNYAYYSNNFNPTFGMQVSIALTLSQIELESKLEVEGYLSRIGQVPRVIEQAVEFEYMKAEKDLLLQSYLYVLTVEQIDSLTESPEQFLIYQGFAAQMEEIDFLTDEEKQTYKEQCLTIVRDEIFPAYEQLKRDLTAIAAMSKNEVGTSEFRDAKGYYEWLLYQKTSYPMSVREMERFIQEEMEKQYNELVAIMENNPELSELFEEGFEFGSYETIEEAVEAAEQLMADNFYDYGIHSARQKTIPAFLEEHLPAGFYFVTSIDGEDYGTMYLQESAYTDVDIDSFSTLLHEDIPGHHMYFSVLYDSDRSFAQKMGDWDTYSEGYAVQVQQYAMKDMLSETPALYEYLETFFKLNYMQEMQRDIDIHVHGMGYEEVRAELLRQGIPEEAIEGSYNRMISRPAEVFSYYFGYYKLEAYKEKFENRMGDDFDIKLYHDFILRHANIPFNTMDGIVDAYLADL